MTMKLSLASEKLFKMILDLKKWDPNILRAFSKNLVK